MKSSAFALVLLASTSSLALADEPVDVVATFSILADMTQVIGGDHVSVTSLVGPGEDAHVYEPVPTDVVAVAGADVMVVNGLGFEGFMERLIDASETEAAIVVATNGVDALETDDHDDHDDHDEHGHDDHDEHAHDDHDDEEHAHDDHDEHDHDEHAHDEHDDHGHDDHAGHGHGPLDPHAWQSLDAAKIYVANIAAGLCEASPVNCSTFEANAADYTAQLAELETEWEQAMANVPANDRILITSHEAFAYLGEDLGLTMLAAQGLSTESEASAAGVATLIDQIRETGAKALFIDSIADPRLLEQIADETGLAITGTLYSDALAVDGEASTYLGMMRSNLQAITAALAGS